MKKIEEYVRSIPDFPEEGVIFRDVTSILQDADGLKLAIDSMQECLKEKGKLSIVYYPGINSYPGRENLQITILSYQ